ncbi:hypothetical protein D3C78_1757880 [compost metagenome]
MIVACVIPFSVTVIAAMALFLLLGSVIDCAAAEIVTLGVGAAGATPPLPPPPPPPKSPPPLPVSPPPLFGW